MVLKITRDESPMEQGVYGGLPSLSPYFRNFTVYGLYKGVLLPEGCNPVQVTQRFRFS